MAVRHVARHAHDVLWSGTIQRQDLKRIIERPGELAVQRIFGKTLMFVPTNDAGGEDHASARTYAIRVALGSGPVWRLQDIHDAPPFSKSRAMICRCTSLAPS